MRTCNVTNHVTKGSHERALPQVSKVKHTDFGKELLIESVAFGKTLHRENVTERFWYIGES